MFKVGTGPDEFSSVTWLCNIPEASFDVNGYYRALGVRWKASRTELREAYLSRNGPESAYLTYVFKQLLNPEIRRQYDLMPMGAIFRDRYEEEKLKRKIQNAIWKERKRRADLGLVELDESVVWNDIQAKKSAMPLARPLSNRYVREQPSWPYSYHIKGVGPDDERAKAWQEALVKYLSLNSLWLRLAVGLKDSRSGAYSLDVEGGCCIFYLAESAEIEDTAKQVAVDLVLQFNSN